MSVLYDSISENEVELIHDYIKYHVQEPKTNIEYILRVWDDAKTDLFKLFGENLILEKKEVTIEKSYGYIKEEIGEFLSGDIGHKLSKNIRDIFLDYPEENDHKQYFPSVEEYHDTFYKVADLLSINTLISNTYVGSTFTVYNKDHSVKIECGMKAMKAIKKICDLYNIEGFEEFRLAHSQILNQKTLKGDLCLSIHPLDYMTMSDNNCGWTSCMHWDKGDYCLGTVEMMNSNYVIVAYLKSKDDFYPIGGSHSWNSKKWRCLYIVNEDMITEVKPYPYDNDSISKIVMDWLKNLGEKNMGWEYSPESYLIQDYNHANPTTLVNLCPEDPIYKFHFETNAMYSDMYEDHKAYLSPNIPHKLVIEYSGKTECMVCGKIDEDYRCTNIPVLDCCNDHIQCYCCGDYYSPDELYELDGELLCQCCYEAEAVECDVCGYEHFRNDYRTIKVCLNGEPILGIDEIKACYDCFVNKYQSRIGLVQDQTYWWLSSYWKLELKDMTEEEIENLYLYYPLNDFGAKSDDEFREILRNTLKNLQEENNQKINELKESLSDKWRLVVEDAWKEENQENWISVIEDAIEIKLNK